MTTFGVGAIVPVEDESFMVAGIDRWSVGASNLHEPRLERELGVDGFVIPPAGEKTQDIPVVRFPMWSSCPSCHRLDKHTFFTHVERDECNSCHVKLIPSRFVVCCPRGHVDDFPYFTWVHRGKGSKSQSHDMTLSTSANTASLRSVVISCSCGASETMEGSFYKTALQGMVKCHGRRPWLTTDDDACDETLRTLQRGASNVWFSVTRSAISIPPWSEGLLKVVNKHWSVLRHVPDDALAPTINGMGIAHGSGYSVGDLVAAVKTRRTGANTAGPVGDQALKEQEYEALVRGKPETSSDQDFVCVPAPHLGDFTTEWFSSVMLVSRLREVRVLQAFSRVTPVSPGEPAERRAPLFESDPGWRPAIEVLGEGVFFDLDQQRLTEWETSAAAGDRARSLDDNYRAIFARWGGTPDRTITPRLVLLHTLAHALINQWSLDSGYPAASIRERLYVSPTMAGMLLYTATTDSAGSLGGIIAQADSARLDETLREALARASWCSADPLCMESGPSGTDGLNRAACHACMLLPEVSCEERNRFLDRASLVGLPGDPTAGLFGGLPA